MAGFDPHEGLGAARLLVASQTQRPQGLELRGAVRREAWHVPRAFPPQTFLQLL